MTQKQIIEEICCTIMSSPFESLLEKWIREKTVSAQTAEKMKVDWKEYETEKSSSRWTVAISTIGALLLGIAAISFISLNWEELHRFEKIGLFLFATFGSFGSGVYLKEIQKEYPKTGHALLFLSTLLFGATLSLISQVYQLSGDAWKLLAIWTIGILPVAYFFVSGAVIRLALVTGIFSLLLFLSGVDTLQLIDLFEAVFFSFLQFPTLLITGGLLFAAGSLHLLSSRFEEMGRILRLLGVKIYLFFLFWLTFSGISEEIFDDMTDFVTHPDAFFWKNMFLVLFAATMAGVFFFKSKKTPSLLEQAGFALTLITALISLFVLESSTGIFLFTIWANFLFIFAIGVLLKEGYARQNLKAVNFATFGIGVFLMGKYIDLFFEDMNTTLFFFIGGVLLIGGGIYLERKRRSLTSSFTQTS